jgi:hypothetical protein
MSAGGAGLATLVAALALVVGGLGALLALLNRRDDRQARLVAVAAAQFTPMTLRSAVAIRVRCAVLSARTTVVVDMGPGDAAELWAAVARLRAALPSAVRLRIEGEIGRSLPARLTVDAVSRGRARPALPLGRRLAC